MPTLNYHLKLNSLFLFVKNDFTLSLSQITTLARILFIISPTAQLKVYLCQSENIPAASQS